MFFFTKCQILAKLSAVILKKGNMRSSAAQRSRIGRESANTKIEKSTRCKMKFPFYLLRQRQVLHITQPPQKPLPWRTLQTPQHDLQWNISPLSYRSCIVFSLPPFLSSSGSYWVTFDCSKFLQTEMIQQIDYKRNGLGKPSIVKKKIFCETLP